MRALALSLALLLGGCAAPCSIESTPPGASVYLDGEYLGKTPLTVNLGARWNAAGTAYGWLMTDERHLLLVEGGEFHWSIIHRGVTSHGIPFWPEAVRDDTFAPPPPPPPATVPAHAPVPVPPLEPIPAPVPPVQR